jgi:hypothetical protein
MQLDASDTTLTQVIKYTESALQLLKPQPEVDTFDDLAAASCLHGLALKAKEDKTVFNQDFSSQNRSEKVVVDGEQTPSQQSREVVTAPSRHIDPKVLQELKFAIEMWLKLLDLKEASSKFIRIPERTLRLIQIELDIFRFLNETEWCMKLCKIQIRLHRYVILAPGSKAEIVGLLAEISELYAVLLGAENERSLAYLNKAREELKTALNGLSDAQKFEWLLRTARFDSNEEIQKRINAVKIVVSEAHKMTKDQKTASNYALLAKAKDAQAALEAQRGNIHDAIALTLETRRFRLSMLPRGGATNPASGAVDTSRYRIFASYFETVLQLGALFEFQGASREARYYYSKGLELARSVGASRQEKRFELKLAQLELKRHQWDDLEDEFQQESSSERSNLVSEGMFVAEQRDFRGDVERGKKKLVNAKKSYEAASSSFLRYTEPNMAQQLERLISTVSLEGSTPSSSAKQPQMLFSPTRDQILRRGASSTSSKTAPRLSMDPSSGETIYALLPIQMQIRSRAKVGLLELASAIEQLSPSLLKTSKDIFSSCISELLNIVGVSSEKDIPQSPFDNDLAMLLFFSARVDFVPHIWPLQRQDPSAESALDQWWSLQAGGSSAERKKLLEKLNTALMLAQRGGSQPNLMGDICQLAALVVGASDPTLATKFVHFGLGLAARHSYYRGIVEKIERIRTDTGSYDTTATPSVDSLVAAFGQLTIGSNARRPASTGTTSVDDEDDDEIEIDDGSGSEKMIRKGHPALSKLTELEAEAARVRTTIDFESQSLEMHGM